jgi:hypothetical protein
MMCDGGFGIIVAAVCAALISVVGTGEQPNAPGGGISVVSPTRGTGAGISGDYFVFGLVFGELADYDGHCISDSDLPKLLRSKGFPRMYVLCVEPDDRAQITFFDYCRLLTKLRLAAPPDRWTTIYVEDVPWLDGLRSPTR